MQRQPVESSNIRSVGYSDERHVLEVEFSTGAIWQYAGVPEELAAEFLRSESLGAFFARRIKPAFSAVKVETEANHER